MIRRIKEKISILCEKIRLERKLRRMDSLWKLYGGSCFGLFPPSFYYRHSDEEIQKIQQEEITKLKELIKECARKNENKA